MTLATLQAQIQRRTGIDYDTTAMADLVNEALQAIAAEHDWPWLHTTGTFSTVAGTGTQAAPASWSRTVMLAINPNYPLRELPHSELERRWPDSSVQGQPVEFAVDNATIYLRPIPDAVYTVTHDYALVETTLSGASDVPLLPPQYQSAVVEYACSRVLDRSVAPSGSRYFHERRSADAMNNYNTWIGRMRTAVSLGRGPHRVRVRAGSFL